MATELGTKSSVDKAKQPVLKPKKKSFIRQIVDNKFLFLLFLPTLLYFILFKYVPMFGLIISFKEYNLFKGVWASEWVGLQWYKMFFSNPDSFKLIWNTLLLGIFKMFWTFPAPIILALMLNELRHKFFKKFVQSVSYLPHFLSNVVIASMVLLFFSPTTGPINEIIAWFGFEKIHFLASNAWWRDVFISSEIWQHVGWGTIIYLAALAGINPSLYEAAQVDGASRWQQTKSITIPGIVPAMVILFLLNVGNIIDLGFEKVYLLQTPVTYEVSDILATYVYRTGLLQGSFSYATAIDLFQSVVAMILVVACNFFARRVNDGENALW